LRILYTVGRYWPAIGGGPLYVRELANRVSQYHDVRVATLANTSAEDAYAPRNISRPRPRQFYKDNTSDVDVAVLETTSYQAAWLKIWLPLYRTARFSRAVWKYSLRVFLEKQLLDMGSSCDIIHDVRIGPDALTWAAYNASRRLSVPFVHTPLVHPAFSPGWLRKIYACTDAIIALTDQEKEQISQWGIDYERIHVISAGPLVREDGDPDRFRRKHDIAGPIILFIARKERYKGCVALLQAAPLVWERFPTTSFVFIGPQYSETVPYFREFTDSRIINLDSVDDQEKADALAACDMLCVPSTEEALGMVYLEAWIYSKPVIACDIPAVRELVTSGVDGLLVSKKQEPQEVAAAINHLLNDPSLRERMGAKGRQKAQGRYSWQYIADAMMQLYDDLVAQRTTRKPIRTVR